MLARDHAVQRTGQRHDAFDRTVGGLQHVVVVAVDRDIGMHIAVTGMHVQRNPDPALEHALVDCCALGADGSKGAAGEQGLQGLAQLHFPAGAQAVVLQLRKQGVHLVQPTLPLGTHASDQGHGLGHTLLHQLGRGHVAGVVRLAHGQVVARQKLVQAVAQRNFVAQAQFNIDALNAVGVFGHARQRNHHVFVDFESVGVLADGRRFLAVQPKLFARLGADGNKAFAAARVGNAHHLGGGARHRIGIVACNVAKQGHFGQSAALGFGGVAHGFQVPIVQMLQARQQHARALLLGKHEVFDLHNAGHRVARVAKKLQHHGAGVGRHAVQHPARAGDQAVAAFFLDAWQAAQELVGDVFAQAFFAKGLAGNVQALGAQGGFAVGLEVLEFKAGHFGVMDLAHVVVKARHFQPLGLGRDHAPARQVVQRRAPQHGFFATRVHGNVAAYAAGLCRGGVHCEHIAAPLRRVGHALGDDAGLAPHRGHVHIQAGQALHLHLGHGLEFFGVDDRALPGQRNRAAGVAGAAAPGNDGQAQVDAALHQTGHFGLRVRREHHKRVFHPPVGGIGHVADARQAVELHVVAGSELVQQLLRLFAQCGHHLKFGIEGMDRAARRHQQLRHHGVAHRVGVWRAAFFHFAQAVVQCVHQLAPALGVVQQVVLQIGVALHHPDVAQHLVQHACRAAGATFFAQGIERLPGLGAQQADHDLAVGERGVVVRDLTDALVRHWAMGQRGHKVGKGGGSVHQALL